MAFLHKLAQRMARLKAVLLLGVVATIACEVPLADPSSTVGRLQLSPKTSSLRTGQTTQFTVVTLTPAGDTAIMGVRWTMTGGTIVDSSTTGGKHYLQYRSPSQPGQYKIVTQSTGAGLSDSAVVTVTAVPVASVSVSPPSTNLTALQSVQLTAFAVDSVGGALTDRLVTWASTNSAIATVNAIGLVTGATAGTVTLTATSEGKSGTATVTVSPAPVASVSVSPAAVSVTIGQTAQLTAIPRDTNGTALVGRVVTWQSGNTGVATVTGSGLVTGVSAGGTVITATSEGKSVTAAITVTPTPAPVASVSVSPASANLSTGQTVQLTATTLDASGNVLVGRVVTWGSSNTGRATVSSNGLVTGQGAGAVTITATSEGQNGSSAITVTAPVATVSVSPTPASVPVGQTVQLTATPRDASGNVLVGRVVTWGSSNTNVATVNGNGLVTGVAPGSVTITATSEGRSGTAAVTVTPTPVASVSVTPPAPSIFTAQTVQLTATPRSASGAVLTGRVITWASGNPGIATVTGNGLVTGVTAGSVTITASSEGINGTATVSVTAAPPPPPGGGLWPNEPAGFTVLNDYGWTDNPSVNGNIGSSGWAALGGDASRVDDAFAPFSPSSVMQIRFGAGFTGGVAPINCWYDIPGANVRELYIGFWFKVSNPWQGHPSQVNKIAFVTSGGTQHYALMPVLSGSSAPYYLKQQIAETGASENPAYGGWLTQNVANPQFTLGVWHRVEMYLKYGTSSSSNNGIMRMWLDGIQTMNYSDINYADNGVDGWKINPTWGGTGSSKAQTEYFWFDHVHTSAP